MAFTKHVLSGSSNGRQIKVVATATPGTIIHNAGTELDEVWLWAVNSDTSKQKLTIEWGGVTAPDDLLEVVIPGESGDVLIIAGKIVTGSVLVSAFAGQANTIMISGFVNRIFQ